MDNDNFFKSSILSGLIIAIASYGYIKTSASIFGTILFAFGLMSIVFYGLHLFTGDAGFIKNDSDNENLTITLLGNVIGCFLGALLLITTLDSKDIEFIDNAVSVREVNNFFDLYKVVIKAIFCGFILTMSVKFAREAKANKDIVKMLPLLFGVPLFLTSGFFHCIVDVFYITCNFITNDIFDYNVEDYMKTIVGWFMVVTGNLIGCNLPRIIMRNREF